MDGMDRMTLNKLIEKLNEIPSEHRDKEICVSIGCTLGSEEDQIIPYVGKKVVFVNVFKDSVIEKWS